MMAALMELVATTGAEGGDRPLVGRPGGCSRGRFGSATGGAAWAWPDRSFSGLGGGGGGVHPPGDLAGDEAGGDRGAVVM